MILTLPQNLIGTDFVVGDIHGCYEYLLQQLVEIKFDSSKDRLIAVGDLIDRGDNSLECLRLINQPWFYSVKGNHEDFITMFFEGYGSSNHISNGGRWFYSLPFKLQSELKILIDKLPLIIEVEVGDKKVAIMHADPCYDDYLILKAKVLNKDEKTISSLLWSRTRIRFSKFKFEDLTPIKNIDFIFLGHTIVPRVTKVHNTIYLDTDVLDNKLTILNIKEIIK